MFYRECFRKAIILPSLALILFISAKSNAGSLYLPLNLSPEIEARIERLFVVANTPIIKRPLTAKQVFAAIDKAKSRDPELAASVRHYMRRYTRKAAITHSSLEIANRQRLEDDIPSYTESNARGYGSYSRYQLSSSAYWVMSDFAAVNLGGIIGERPYDQKDEFADGSFISLGWDSLQADIGYRPHWWSPFQESAMMISTQAPTLPSITISNVVPFSFLGLSYELFVAQMSESDEIKSEADSTSRLTGDPRLMGVHFNLAPIDGFAIGFNRLMQFGGADRSSGVKDVANAFFNAQENENIDQAGRDFGNQLSSITTRYTSAGDFPLSVYMEYAGEDSSLGSSAHLGNTSLMLGVHIPKLTDYLDLTWEHAEWQNSWYVNNNYGDGLRHYDSVIGHWSGDQRQKGDAKGGKSQTIKLLWDIHNGKSLLIKYEEIEKSPFSNADYTKGEALTLQYSQSFGRAITGLTLSQGTSVFGGNFSQLSGFIRW